jgi:hypothetical protein
LVDSDSGGLWPIACEIARRCPPPLRRPPPRLCASARRSTPPAAPRPLHTGSPPPWAIAASHPLPGLHQLQAHRVPGPAHPRRQGCAPRGRRRSGQRADGEVAGRARWLCRANRPAPSLSPRMCPAHAMRPAGCRDRCRATGVPRAPLSSPTTQRAPAACEDPNVLEMMDCCRHLKLPADIEDKQYPRDWWMSRGRLRVQLFGEDGAPTNPEVPTRERRAGRAGGFAALGRRAAGALGAWGGG